MHLSKRDQISVHKLQPLVIHYCHQCRAVVANGSNDASVRIFAVDIPHGERRPEVGEDVGKDAPNLSADECDGRAMIVAVVVEFDGDFIGKIGDDDGLRARKLKF